MFVHIKDKLAEMRTKFHVIQAKLIMSVWYFTVHCSLLLSCVVVIITHSEGGVSSKC